VSDLLKTKHGVRASHDPVPAPLRGVASCKPVTRRPSAAAVDASRERQTPRESAFGDSRENPVLASADETLSLRA
jgi:hypothetical protein